MSHTDDLLVTAFLPISALHQVQCCLKNLTWADLRMCFGATLGLQFEFDVASNQYSMLMAVHSICVFVSNVVRQQLFLFQHIQILAEEYNKQKHTKTNKTTTQRGTTPHNTTQITLTVLQQFFKHCVHVSFSSFIHISLAQINYNIYTIQPQTINTQRKHRHKVQMAAFIFMPHDDSNAMMRAKGQASFSSQAVECTSSLYSQITDQLVPPLASGISLQPYVRT